MKPLSQISILDPFILPHVGEGFYYLFGTTRLNPCEHPLGGGFDCYTSRNLSE